MDEKLQGWKNALTRMDKLLEDPVERQKYIDHLNKDAPGRHVIVRYVDGDINSNVKEIIGPFNTFHEAGTYGLKFQAETLHIWPLTDPSGV